MKKILSFIGLLSVLFLVTACGSKNAQQDTKTSSDKKLKIITTFYPMYDFTKQVVGDDADVSMLIEAGVEPHDYEPSAKDMAKIQEADVFVYNSNEMETWVGAVLKNIDTDKVQIIEASKGIKLLDGQHEEEGDEHEGHDHAYDPHVWLDPVLAKQEVATITANLTDKFPDKKANFEKNSQDYQKKLEGLNDDYVSAFKGATTRKFVTQHQAFSYLAHQYDLTQIPISGLNPDQEPTPKELKQIEDLVKKEQVSIIYVENIGSAKIAKTISSATGAELKVLNPLESLSKKDQEAGQDYLSVMKENLNMLKLTIK
ncbi:zinc ABC transporter substrate-binding protein [Vagococcus penaei]|uniref:metal ABC transporter substrate-binding protein n=1 Tax=Vagococcus penaei TaxID=633807 RepID=UPI000F85FED0|nr:metal ABC transporter substrate-binding protein [Vagococcus penaei]RSU06109.1 zinc ABC transporter substrate-binding protein [Vagococcus penaei]